jgi:hypothetical protein
MWRDRDRYPDHNYVPDTFWLVVAALLFAACGLVWLIGQVAAISFGPHHQHLSVRLVDMLGVLLRLPGTWDDPAQAWPPSSQPLLPGPVGMYAAAILTFWIPAFLYGLLVRLVSPRARRRRRERGARWASWWQLRRLLVLGPRRGRIILGRRDRLRDRLLGRLYLAVEGCHSVLAFGPPGSFKTHGLVIPAILEWQGNLVTTSIKPDVLRATCAHRASLGAVWVYDPLGLSGVPGARWTPLAHCRTYSDARRIGRMLAEATDIGGHRAEDANYWQLLGAKLLSVLLFAAAGTGRSMADVARWVDVQDIDDVAQALMEIGPPGPGCLGGLHQPPRQHHGQRLWHRRDLAGRVRRPGHRPERRGLRLGPGRAADRRQQHPLPLRAGVRAGATATAVRAPRLGSDLEGGGAGRRPTQRHARPQVVRLFGRGWQLRRHQEAPPACDHRPWPRDPAADHLA